MSKHKNKKLDRRSARRQARQGDKKLIGENTLIANFIGSISEKNYKVANKYLQSIVMRKLQKRIANSIEQPLF